MIALLRGKKTYIVAFIAAVLNFCVLVGWITPDNLTVINSILAALGLAAVRAGIEGK